MKKLYYFVIFFVFSFISCNKETIYMQGVIIEKNKNIYIENIVSKDIKYYVEEKQELYIIDVETNNGTIISYNDKKDYEKFDVGDTIEMKIENIYLFNKHLFYKVTDVKK